MLPADEARDARRRPGIASLDLGGAVLFAGGLAGVLVALKRAQDHGWSSGPALGVGVFALVALAVFARHEALLPSPLLPLALLRRPPFSLGVVGAVLLYTVTFMLAYLMPVYLQRSAGLSPTAAGAYMTAQPATMAVIAPVSGVIADRWGPRLPSAAGMLTISTGLACLTFTASAAGAPLALSLALVGAGAGLYVAPNSALIMGAAPHDRQGVAGAMAATARNLGMTLGIAIAASLYHVRWVGFRGSVLVAAGLALAGVLLAAVRPSSEAPSTAQR
jgi:predicted MFS family arabinose efflux permease